MIKGTKVKILKSNYGSAFREKTGIIEKVVHDKERGTYFVIGFDGRVLSYPFYANEFEEMPE